MSKTTVITIYGKYKVTCEPDPEPAVKIQNDVEAYISITELLKKKLLTNVPTRNYSVQALQEWVDKFPKHIK